MSRTRTVRHTHFYKGSSRLKTHTYKPTRAQRKGDQH